LHAEGPADVQSGYEVKVDVDVAAAGLVVLLATLVVSVVLRKTRPA
jgi:hypothetical protein